MGLAARSPVANADLGSGQQKGKEMVRPARFERATYRFVVTATCIPRTKLSAPPVPARRMRPVETFAQLDELLVILCTSE